MKRLFQLMKNLSNLMKKSVIDPETKNETTVLDVMQLLSNHDLHTAFPNLFLAYQGLCTLPASSSSFFFNIYFI